MIRIRKKWQRYGYDVPGAVVSCVMLLIDDIDPRIAVRQGANVVRSRWNEPVIAAIIAGSGFSSIIDVGEIVDKVPYSAIPGLPQSTISGHGSELLLINTEHGFVLLFTGRSHAYEGHRPAICASHVALAMEVGVNHLILTNACGGINPLLHVGDVVIPTDVMNMTSRSIRCPVQRTGSIVDSAWVQRASSQCWANGVPVKSGTYVQVLGPSFETRSEIGMMRRCGADVIGMSTIVEATWASQMGARVSLLSLVTNTLTDTQQRPISHHQVMEIASTSGNRVSIALLSTLETIQ